MIFLFIPFIISLFLLESCTSTDKTQSYMSTASLKYSCLYDLPSNTTSINFTVPISNNTIYKIDKLYITFYLYNNGTLIKNNHAVTYSTTIDSGKSYTGEYIFEYSAQITDIKVNGWSAHYQNLWDSYKAWWITIISVVSVLAFIYLILVIVFGFDMEDIFVNIGSGAIYILLAIIPAIVNAVKSINNWFPYVIGLIGVVSLIVFCIIVCAIDEAIACDSCSLFGAIDALSTIGDTDPYAEATKKVEACDNNPIRLQKLSKKTLSDYCFAMKIETSNYSKKDMINDIIKYNENSEERAKETKKNLRESKSKKSKYKIRFDDIAGLNLAKEAFKEKVILPFEHPDLFKKFNKKAGGGILLYGLPGTGKTMFAEACSNEADALFIPVKCSDIKSKWYGESEQLVKQIFSKARNSKAKKAIIFFDEFEAIGVKRTDDQNNGNNDLVPQILTEMQGIGSGSGDCTIVVIAATNKPWSIDSAFLRPGRFDEKIYIPLPDFEARKKLFELRLKDIPTKELDYTVMANITDGFNGADIAEFAERLKMKAIHKSLQTNKDEPITMDDVNEVRKEVKSSVRDEDIEMLEQFQNMY